ncbi:hypothetical protein ACWAT4_37010 [Bradyrhizobium manausense]
MSDGDLDYVVWLDKKTGLVWRQEYRLNEELHRPENEGPARIDRHRELGVVDSEEYYWKGKLHREDGPAVTDYQNDEIVQQKWYRHGVLHRDPKEGPAWLLWDSGVVIEEKYLVYGRYYRRPEDGPYKIERDYKTGEVLEQFTMTAEETSRPAPAPPKGFPTQSTRSVPSPA